MQRALKPHLIDALGEKIILLSGPRQVGKTTLAKDLLPEFSYYNFDSQRDSRVFRSGDWDRETPLVIFDELHKKKNWKLWLKGFFDSGDFKTQAALVTGSARLSHIKKVGDSLAGRYFEFRLHPLDLKELKGSGRIDSNFERLLNRGGFPEPFLQLSEEKSRIWRRTHTDTILRQDLLSLEVIRDLESVSVLIELLSQRVGSTISVHNLAQDLKVSDGTVRRWIGLLQDLYVVFPVTSFAKNLARGLTKSVKLYFFDLGRIESDIGARFENLVALALRKEMDFLEDTQGLKCQLNFVRNKEKQEIDFLVRIQGQPPSLIETKWSDDRPSRAFFSFEKAFPGAKKIQLVANLSRSFNTATGVRIQNAPDFLENLSLKSGR